METQLSFTIFDNTASLPEGWDEIASGNIFLRVPYLKVLESSAPTNMSCFFIGMYSGTSLCGVAIAQLLDINKLTSFGERDRCVKTSVRNFFFRNYCANVLFIGNNMLSGQNAFAFSNGINLTEGLRALHDASYGIETLVASKGKKVQLLSFKDFPEEYVPNFIGAGYGKYYQFSTQPNMVFDIRQEWKSEQDYIDALSKKYRDQYKRARKKAAGIVKRKMTLADINANQETINSLYKHVAENAPFNTFFLAETHFSEMKQLLADKFKFYGYFDNEKLIGFNTLIINGSVMDTYFLGYDDFVQKEKMLYLNMLYDMIAYSIKKKSTEIVFARTALEIKSSVGAHPEKMYGFIRHTSPLLSKALPILFPYLEPELKWKQRSPFRTEAAATEIR